MARPLPHFADVAPQAINGRFFGPEGDVLDVPDDLRDPELRQRLWRVSEDLSGLSESPSETQGKKRTSA